MIKFQHLLKTIGKNVNWCVLPLPKKRSDFSRQSLATLETRVYGKRQTSESRLRFLKINKPRRIVQNNFCVYGKHESTYLHLVTANGKRQMMRNHGHVVPSAVCRFPQTGALISLLFS